MTLTDLVRRAADAKLIGEHLDALPQARRIEEVMALSASDQKSLYELAATAPPVDFEFFVPADVPDGHEVVHYGRNSLPAFRSFQKRWCRPRGRTDQLYGYNETLVRPLIGPGYFVARETDGGGRDPRGAIVVDYYQVPEGPVAVGWPLVRPNSRVLQRFVYFETRDYMRRFSSHCSIGAAHKQEKKLIGYFVLCRDESTDA
jgi:hypothetical protein